MVKDDWVFWLNITNIALGVIVAMAVLMVAYAVVWELVSRRRKSLSVANHEADLAAMLQYGRSVPGLGVTMADGRDPINPVVAKSPEKKDSKE
jgi:hypothetical protein